MSSNIREASHANSWYVGDAKSLQTQLEGFLTTAKLTDSNARAVISPHAGYSYSGQSAAYAYINLDKTKVKRIFILGPSHHFYLTKCALSKMDTYATPLGDIKLDKEVIKELYDTGSFDWMDKSVDEDEHSIEMQLPFIANRMQGNTSYTLVPVLVGSLSKDSEKLFGSIFSKYLADDSNFFVISSDFCHWGKRFNYTYYDVDAGPIHKSIELLDREGMKIIESQHIEEWYSYLKSYKNTICGRHPIGVFLNAVNQCTLKHSIQFVYYAQSSKCVAKSDSSVSYAVAVTSKV